MRRLIIVFLTCLLLCGCASSNTKEKKTDVETPSINSVLEENIEIQSAAESAYHAGQDYWDSVQPNYQPVDKNCVYWVEKGYAYHSNQYCVALLNSKNIQHGSLEEAKKLGHDHPCSKCVGGK